MATPATATATATPAAAGDPSQPPLRQRSKPDPLSKRRRKLLRAASRSIARPKDQSGNYDVTPLKSFEKPEPGSSPEEVSPLLPPLVAAAAAAAAAAAPPTPLADLAALPETKTGMTKPTPRRRRGMLRQTTSSQIAAGSQIVFQMSTSSAGAGVIFVFFMLYSSVPLLLLSRQTNAVLQGAIRVGLAVAMAIFQLWPLRCAGMPHFVKFSCCILAFALVGILIAGEGVDTGPGGVNSDADGVSEEVVVHFLMIVIHLVCLAPQNMGLGRIGVLSCLILLHLKNHYVDEDAEARPHYGTMLWLALAFFSSSYAALVGLL
jgi:hypothetical protein